MEEGDKINDEFIVGREEQAQKTAGSLTKLFEEERKKEEEEEEGKGDTYQKKRRGRGIKLMFMMVMVLKRKCMQKIK